MMHARRPPVPWVLSRWILPGACLWALVLTLPGLDASALEPSAPSGHELQPVPRTAETPPSALPTAWLPPGSGASPVPSDKIFPVQTLPLHFNHKKHVQGLGLACAACHPRATTSDSERDGLLPKPASTCDRCHRADHADLRHVVQGKPDGGTQEPCAFCHVGATPGDGGVAPVIVPRPNVHFSHKKHQARNIQCGQCHGHVEEVSLATRDQLPRMAGCFACHDLSGAAQGDAKGTCVTCHVSQRDGRIQTALPAGPLFPPRWLRSAGHDADWIERHKAVAADDSAFCGTCHTSQDCIDCHDGNVRPRTIHPNDWLSMHPQAARQDNPRCSNCHQEQTFCADCHRRAGVARDAPSGNRIVGRRFHPPPEQWTTAPRGPMHHAWEAERNLNACVSCHSERDCATCHATRGQAGGQGVNPHPTGFRGKCGQALRQNPRPCLVCHPSGDGFVSTCR